MSAHVQSLLCAIVASWAFILPSTDLTAAQGTLISAGCAGIGLPCSRWRHARHCARLADFTSLLSRVHSWQELALPVISP